jgi:hypothetical protein
VVSTHKKGLIALHTLGKSVERRCHAVQNIPERCQVIQHTARIEVQRPRYDSEG